MNIHPLVAFLLILGVIAMLRLINTLLNRIVLLDRQLDRMRVSRDNWRDITKIRRKLQGQEQEEENDHD